MKIFHKMKSWTSCYIKSLVFFNLLVYDRVHCYKNFGKPSGQNALCIFVYKFIQPLIRVWDEIFLLVIWMMKERKKKRIICKNYRTYQLWSIFQSDQRLNKKKPQQNFHIWPWHRVKYFNIVWIDEFLISVNNNIRVEFYLTLMCFPFPNSFVCCWLK